MRRSLLVLLLAGLAICPIHGAGNVDAAFKAFWDAPSVSAAEKASHAVVGTGVSFDDAWTRLKAGRTYAKEKTGLIRHPSSVGAVTIDNIIEVPAEYDAAKDVARIDLRRRTVAEPIESLTMWLIPSTAPGKAQGELRLAWGRSMLSTPWSVK